MTTPTALGAAAPSRTSSTRWRRLLADSAYLLTGMPIAVASFSVLVTGLALGAGLLVTLLGLPVLVLTLATADAFAALERTRLTGMLGEPLPAAPRRLRPHGWGIRSWWHALRDPQSWLELLHGLVMLPVTIATWTVTVTWWALAVGGLSWPVWGRWADRPGNDDVWRLLGLHGYGARSVAYVAVGLFAAATLPAVLRACAKTQAALGRALLANGTVAALRARVETLTASRSAAADAEAQSLRRLERDIHDGPQQRLVRLAMDLSTVQRRLDTDPESARPLVGEALAQTKEAIAELRALSRGIAPPVLADRGLVPALAAVAARASVHVDLDVRLADGERLPAAVENTAYFLVAEALTNVAKHSGATTCHVVVARRPGGVQVLVEDDGVGGAALAKGHGLAGLADRVAGVDGTLVVDSPVGGPTRLVAELPCG